MKHLLLTIGILLYSFSFGQQILWTSTTGGSSSNGAIISYDLGDNTLSTMASLEGNPLKGPSFNIDQFYFNNDEFLSEGLIAGSNGMLYGISTLIGYEADGPRGGVYQMDPNTNELSLLHSFTGKNLHNRSFPDSVYSSFGPGLHNPVLGLTEASNGYIYGLANKGGQYDKGGIYTIEISSGNYQKIADFDTLVNGIGYTPKSPLIEGPNGDLFGVLHTVVTSPGVHWGVGYLYKIDINNNTVSIVTALDADGWAIIDPVSQIAYNPSQNKILGTKETFGGLNAGGGVYSYDFNTTDVTNETIITTGQTSTLGDLGNGISPVANDGFHYFTCRAGGANGQGTLVQYNQNTNTMVKIHDFTHTPSGTGIIIVGTKVYGTYLNLTAGDPLIWSYDVGTLQFSNVINGSNPSIGHTIYHSFAVLNGELYAHNTLGLNQEAGNIFKHSLINGADSVIHVNKSPNGRGLVGEIAILNDSIAYTYIGAGGVERPNNKYSEQGGIAKINMVNGTVQLDTIVGEYYEIDNDRNTTKYNKLLISEQGFFYASKFNRFGSSSESCGFSQINSLTGASQFVKDANSFHETYTTGAVEYSSGNIAFLMGDSIFSYNENSQTLSSYYVNVSAAEVAYNNLILASNGKIYGTTINPSQDQCSVFSVDTVNWLTTIEHTFNGPYELNNGLTEYNGKLYGNTFEGGTNDDGYIFSIDINTSTFNQEYSFDYAVDGGGFIGEWLLHNDLMYAVSYTGGQNGYGTLVEFNPTTSSLTVLENLDISNGRAYRASPAFWDDTFLSLKESELNTSIKVYPNPANSIVYIEGQNVDLVQIYSMTGELSIESKNSSMLDISGLVKGVYIVKVHNDTGIHTTKLVKN